MRSVGLSLLVLLFASIAAGYEVTVVLRNYDDFAELRVINRTTTFFEGKIRSGQVISLPAGEYTFELSAMNKVFLKPLIVEENKTIEFNLEFTESEKVLEVKIHSIIFEDASVEEIIMISNNASLNFEGDLRIPIPEIENLQVISSNLDFLEMYVEGNAIVFRSLLVPENSSGGVRIAYFLAKDTIERDLENKRIIVAPLVEVEEFSGLNKTFREMGGGKVAIFEGSGKIYMKFRFTKPFPISLLSIPLITFAVFMFLFSKRGGWRVNEGRRP